MKFKLPKAPNIEVSILHWLQDRQEVIITLQDLCEHRPFNVEDCEVLGLKLQIFFQKLVDYLSFGHFKVFEQLMHPSNNQCFEALLHSTWAFLNLNEKYQPNASLDQLEGDLSLMAEHLAYRLDWEDRLLFLV